MDPTGPIALYAKMRREIQAASTTRAKNIVPIGNGFQVSTELIARTAEGPKGL
jgi:hypothetical protein